MINRAPEFTDSGALHVAQWAGISYNEVEGTERLRAVLRASGC